MRIGLIDVDGHHYPNLPLMKLSAYHKAQGDCVEWYSPWDNRYDIVYKSKVFSFSPDYDCVINADKVITGGTGYCINTINGVERFDASKNTALPYEIEHIMPDYCIYPMIQDTAYGFLSRGCPRGCSFCHVAAKEGRKSYKVADLNEWWSGQKNIVLYDANILACRDWPDLLSQLADSGAAIDFNQGLDIRLMTREKADAIDTLKIKEIHFAWDNYADKDAILPRLKMFREISKINQHNAIVYVLCNYNSTIEQDLERIYTLRDIGYWPYVMLYDKQNAAPIYNKLQRWCNNRYIFAVCDKFDNYNG